MKGFIKVKFKDVDDLYIYDDYLVKGSSPLCTKEQYENFEDSYAYVSVKNNAIIRYGVQIGTLDDLVFSKQDEKNTVLKT